MTDITTERMKLLYEEEKILDQSIQWEPKESGRWAAEARVLPVDSDAVMTVQGKVWQKGYSFALLYHNTVVRLWDFNDHHKGISGGHKHPYTSDGVYGKPYDVDHIPTNDVNKALIEFLDECSIRYKENQIAELKGISDYV